MRAVFFLIRKENQIDGPDRGQFTLAKHGSQHKTELLQLSKPLARCAVAGVAKDVERAGAVFHPVRRKHGGGQQGKREDTPEHLLIS